MPYPARQHLQLVPGSKDEFKGMGLPTPLFISAVAIKHLSLDQNIVLAPFLSLSLPFLCLSPPTNNLHFTFKYNFIYLYKFQ